MKWESTLSKIRYEIIKHAVNDKRLNNLQLSEITKYVFSSIFFVNFDEMTTITMDYQILYDYMKKESYSMVTPKHKLN